MEKIIKRTISLTTKKRDSRNKLFEEFYSHDKNNAVFEFTVENGIPTEDIIVLFHFKRTNRHLEVRGRVDNDKIIVNFDTSLIIKDEQVAGYIYYENGDKSNDVYRFMFDVHVSEIDKEHDLPVMEMESKRIVPLTDIVTKSEITELLKKIVANEKLYDDTEIKQKIELKADKEAVQTISSKVEALEAKADNDTVYNDAEIRGQIATKADTQSVEAIAKRVETLESKPDNDTIYNDTELRQSIETKAEKEALLQFSTKNELKEVSDKVHELENRPQVDISGLATKQEVEAIPKVNVDSLVTKEELAQKGYLTAHQDISNLVTNDELESKHYLTEHQSLEELVTKSELEQKGYLTAHQSLEDYSKKNELDRVTERVRSLEARPQVDTSKLVSKEELEQKNYLTRHQSLENVVTKQELEAKGYLTNHQDLSEYAKKTEIPPQFDSKPLVDRIDLLESKAIANGAYNDKPLLDKIHEVQESLKGFITQSSRYLTEHQSLAHLVTKDELASKGYITNHQSLEHLVTKEELEAKGYLKAHQDVSNLATNAKVEAVETRVQTIENKPAVDLSPFVTKQELEEKQYLKNHQSLEGYVKKSELPPTVDTSTLVSKQELTSMNLVNAESLGEVSKKILEQTTKITALEVKSAYEIHGTGMPNGRVSAPIGTTYVDTIVTNGALKWIKESGDGDRGWKILSGDTGWRTLNSVSKLGNSFVKVRRVNNQITYQFGGLQWGWFGIVRRGGGGYFSQPTDTERNCYILNHNKIPEGFRTPNSLIGAIYNDRGVPYGTWYIGNPTDANHLRFQFLNPIPTDQDIGDIRVSSISYYTDDEWPSTLP